MRGTKYCRIHLGQTVAKAQFKALPSMEVAKWGIDDTTIDPGVTLLRLVSQSARRCAFYGELLGATYRAAEIEDEQRRNDGIKEVVHTSRVSALIGVRKQSTPKGDIYDAEEVIRAFVQLESAERDRCAQFCAKAIQAGIAERVTSIAEEQAAAIVMVMMRALSDPDLGLTGEQRGKALRIVESHVMELEASTDG